MEVAMRATAAIRMGILAAALAVLGVACGDDSSNEDRECRRCATSDTCENDQECVLAVDGEQRCFELDRATCTLDRVEVGRAPTTGPTPVPQPTE
jgi:hypothetical protein